MFMKTNNAEYISRISLYNNASPCYEDPPSLPWFSVFSFSPLLYSINHTRWINELTKIVHWFFGIDGKQGDNEGLENKCLATSTRLVVSPSVPISPTRNF